MTIDWVPAQLPLDTEGRRIVDTALGILIGLRRCSSDAAFQELHDAAQRHKSRRSLWLGRSSISPVVAHDHSDIQRRSTRRAPRMGAVARAIRRADRLTASQKCRLDLK